MAETTPIGNINIIRPFRWWKTFGINCAIASPAALLVAAGNSKAIDPAVRMGEILGGFIGAEAVLGAALALMICIAQTWALNAYYWSGRRKKVYYACLYTMSVAVPLLEFLVLGLVGLMVVRPDWNSNLSGTLAFFIMVFLSLTSYFVGRRIAKAQIAKMNGTPPPLPALAPPNPQLVPERVKPSYAWPLAILASAIVIAAAIFYVASFKQQPAPISAPAQEQAEQGLRRAPTAVPYYDKEQFDRADEAYRRLIGPIPTPSPTPRKAIPLVVLAETISPAVVTLTAYNSDGEGLRFGTGFFIDEIGTIATNWHVIRGASKVTAKTSTGEIFKVAEVLVYETGLDMAVIWLGPTFYDRTGRKFHSLAEGYKESPPRVGSSVVVLGTPEGLEQSLSQGIVSAIRHDEAGTVIQITAPISEGSSGSPVVDDTGALIGIATKTSTEGQSLNFARSYADLEAISERTKPRSFAEIFVERTDALLNSELVKTYIRAAKENNMREKARNAFAIREAFPDVSAAYMWTGELFVELRDWKRAIAEYEQARLLFPEFPDTWDRLAELYEWTGQTSLAQRCFSRAKQLQEKRHMGSTSSTETSPETGAIANAQMVSCHIVGLRAGDKLNVRSRPGVNYPTVASFSPKQSEAIQLRDGEGEQVTNGGDTWRKVYSAATGANIGWANSKYFEVGR